MFEYARAPKPGTVIPISPSPEPREADSDCCVPQYEDESGQESEQVVSEEE